MGTTTTETTGEKVRRYLKERPMIFSAHSVRSILAGEKSQTRRLVKPSAYQRRYTAEKWGGFDSPVQANQAAGLAAEISTGQGLDVCPHGKVGDRIWVREAWWQLGRWSTVKIHTGGRVEEVPRYWRALTPERADERGQIIAKSIRYGADDPGPPPTNKVIWRKISPLFLPRWASRLTLAITEVRLERLCSITEADARAEGYADVAGFMAAFVALNDPQDKVGWWRADPWVFVISFRRVP